MHSTVVKRSVVVGGRKTSVSLEDAFWSGLKELATAQKTTVSALIKDVERQKQGNLSSALRLFVLDSVQRRAAECREGSAEWSI